MKVGYLLLVNVVRAWLDLWYISIFAPPAVISKLHLNVARFVRLLAMIALGLTSG